MKNLLTWLFVGVLALSYGALCGTSLRTHYDVDVLIASVADVQESLDKLPCLTGGDPTGADTEILEITTPDGRYTITVERPTNGLLEMRTNEEPEAEPGELIWPRPKPEIFNTDWF